ncbi:PTS glucose transporter subunit IIA [Pseudoalteromonas sp. MMG012]|uniref:PTS glucose transporter subunit IIA n=1 Tax=Pseudoalteromonas sp. MMG012 TaxID=2822686 RepID=UPI001B3A4CD5|nr:PTS glucose transporter subunit IIA [Pseudoalteromonas sp. MMG012]MBQ4850066.1 PTS glucose transporter subunit IIA [Pseudoalteromonas sp. MMG012]
MQFSPVIAYTPINAIPNPFMHLASPFSGKVLPLSSHPEHLFSQGMLGRGVCVQLSSCKVVSPVHGTIEQINRHGTEYIITAQNGLKVLVNILIPAEYSSAQYQTANAFGKTDIQQGEILAYFDIPSSVAPTMGSLVLINAEKLGPCYHPLKQVSAGQDPLITLTKT